jgi:hypothetical protein
VGEAVRIARVLGGEPFILAERGETMIDIEYIDNGKRVIIPAEVWEAVKELAEHAEIYELIQERKDQEVIYSLDHILAEEGLSREYHFRRIGQAS